MIRKEVRVRCQEYPTDQTKKVDKRKEEENQGWKIKIHKIIQKEINKKIWVREKQKNRMYKMIYQEE